MALQFDPNPPLLAHRYGKRDGDESVGEYNNYCEARSKFFDRFQMPWKENYELEHTSLCKHSHMPRSKGKINYVHISRTCLKNSL